MMQNEMTFRPKIFKTLLLLIVSVLFTIGGFSMIQKESVEGWLITVFFGICLMVFLIQLIPGSTQLKLTSEGFEMTSLFRKSMVKWKDVRDFKVGHVYWNKTIKFDYNENHDKQQVGKKIAKTLSGKHGVLPDTYGLKAAELLEILNTWTNKYGG